MTITKAELDSMVVHFKKEPFDIYIGRPSKWGNPFTHIVDKHTLAEFVVKTREESIMKYLEWITKGNGRYLIKDLHELKGKVLGCWCKPKPCHGEVLYKLVQKFYPDNKNNKNNQNNS